ncbi:hypothetical protein R69746_08705 [Paraburkholderia aspalathi]|nr:hypothetical protein R75465_08442 [Paraburkholderia aspalathi]CAE6874884.1 hypothetical protein R69746_08705 [Paraburkholderia aspalathi]
MRGEEGFDLSRGRHAQPVDRCPPAAPAWNSHGQVGERPDAMRVQGLRGPRRQPLSDVIADLRLRGRQRAKRLDRTLDRTSTPQPFVERVLEYLGQVRPVPVFGEGDQLPANAPQHGTRGLA